MSEKISLDSSVSFYVFVKSSTLILEVIDISLNTFYL